MKRSHPRTLLWFGLAAMLSGMTPALSGCVVHGAAYAVYEAPPPPRRVVVYSRPGYIWVQGRWIWSSGRYYWRDGYWLRERQGYTYVQGSWVNRSGRYVWVEPRWEVRRDVRVRDHRAPPPSDEPRVRVRDHRY
jgi:hypothetical protein